MAAGEMDLDNMETWELRMFVVSKFLHGELYFKVNVPMVNDDCGERAGGEASWNRIRLTCMFHYKYLICIVCCGIRLTCMFQYKYLIFNVYFYCRLGLILTCTFHYQITLLIV